MKHTFAVTQNGETWDLVINSDEAQVGLTAEEVVNEVLDVLKGEEEVKEEKAEVV